MISIVTLVSKIQSNRYAIDPNFKGRSSLKAQLLLFRIQDLCAQYENCDHIITVVREKHIPFYKRMLGFDQISESKFYPWVNEDLVLLSSKAETSRSIITTKGMESTSHEEISRYEELCKLLNN